MKNKVTKDDLIENIKDFPIEVVQKMIDYQIDQGNPADIKVFQINPMFSKEHGGFTWNKTKEGSDFWDDIITWKKFDLFFQKYPKLVNSEFPLPPENMRVWIRGNEERGEEVIKALTDLGAKNIINQSGDQEEFIYFITIKGLIDIVSVGSDEASWISILYKEIKLPWKPKDKELVWAWDYDCLCGRSLIFYDGEHDRSYDFKYYNYYAPYEGEWPEWAKEAVKKLKD